MEYAAQDNLLEIALDLYRIRQRLYHQLKGLKAEYENVREYYDSEAEPKDEPRPLELEVAERADQAADQIEDIADDLRKASHLTTALIEMHWRVDQKKRLK